MASPEFDARLRQIEAQLGVGSPPEEAPVETFESKLQQIEQSRAQAAQASNQTNQPQSEVTIENEPEAIESSVRRMQRMEQWQREIDASIQRMADTPGTPKSPLQYVGDLVEKGINPVFQIGSAVASVISKAKADPNDPEVQKVLGARPGVPFMAEGDPQGASFMQRLATQFTFNRAETAYALMANNPNVVDVRFNTLGDPIMTVRDPDTKQEKDILADPLGIDPGDFAFVLANAPAMLAGGIAAFGRDPKTLQGASRLARWFLSSQSGVSGASARMAGAGGAAGIGTDIAARTGMAAFGEIPGGSEGIQPMETIARRGEGAVVDFLFGNIMGGAGKLAGRAVTPFGQRGPIQMNADAAAALWRREGVDYLFTPGERTGSPFLLRGEAFQTPKPGASGVIAGIQEQKQQAQQQIQRILLGTDPSAVPPADLVGERALQAIGQRLTPLDTVVDKTTQDVLETAAQEIKSNIAAATGMPIDVSQSAVGQNLFKGAESRYAQFEAQRTQLYDAVKSDPRVFGQGRNIDATPLANDAQSILDSMAAYEKQVQQPSLIAGPTGQPQTRTVTKTNPLDAFTDSTTRNALEQLASAKGGQLGYADLIEIRHDVGRAIQNAKVMGGIPEKRVESLYAILSQNIESGLKSLDPSGGLTTAWKKANDFTREGMESFQQVDILPIFKDSTKRGALDLYDIVRRAFNDPGKWQAYKEFFGDKSPEMVQLRRAYADNLTGRTIGSGSVNSAAFAQRLAHAFETNGDIVDDVFRGNTKNLKGLADTAEAMAKGGGNVDIKSLLDSLANNSLTKKRLKDLETLQAIKEGTERNSILANMRKGNFQDEPSKVVDNVVFSSKAEPQEVREMMSLISDPKIKEELAQRTLLRIFQESTSGPVTKENVRSKLLEHFTQDHGGNMMGSRVEAVIGKDRFTKLKSTIDLLRPEEISQPVVASAGGLASGSKFAQWEKAFTNPNTFFGALGDTARSWALTLGYMYGPIRNFLGNNVLGNPADRAAFANAFVSGAPTVENFAQMMGEGVSRDGRILAIQMKNAIDAQIRESSSDNRATGQSNK